MTLATGAHATEAKAVFAGGCFWCMESEFEQVEGIVSAVSGYIGGEAGDANYEAVSAHKTTHVEAVEITYDPAKVDYAKLLDIYWGNIDPTDAGGQMYDRGAQYATVIYYANDSEKKLAEDSKIAVGKKLGKPIATRIEPLTPFYPTQPSDQATSRQNNACWYLDILGRRRKEEGRR